MDVMNHKRCRKIWYSINFCHIAKERWLKVKREWKTLSMDRVSE